MPHLVTETLLGTIRFGGYLGYVLIAGTLAFWAIVWPEGTRDRTLVRLAYSGVFLTLLTTVISPVVAALADGISVSQALGRLGVAASLMRIGALVLTISYLPDLISRRPNRNWRIIAASLSAFIGLTFVMQSDAVHAHWPVLTVIATVGHIVATGTWLGGLLALATVLIPRSHLEALHQVLSRFSILAMVSVATLTLTGIIHAIAVAGGIRPLLTMSYGLVLALKIGLFGLMLLLGNHGRAYASKVAHRNLQEFDESASPAGLRALAIAIGAELAFGIGVLAITSLLVAAVPASI